MFEIIKSKSSGGYLPKHDEDLEMFMHCTGGSMEVKDIDKYMPVFYAHGFNVSTEHGV